MADELRLFVDDLTDDIVVFVVDKGRLVVVVIEDDGEALSVETEEDKLVAVNSVVNGVAVCIGDKRDAVVGLVIAFINVEETCSCDVVWDSVPKDASVGGIGEVMAGLATFNEVIETSPAVDVSDVDVLTEGPSLEIVEIKESVVFGISVTIRAGVVEAMAVLVVAADVIFVVAVRVGVFPDVGADVVLDVEVCEALEVVDVATDTTGVDSSRVASDVVVGARIVEALEVFDGVVVDTVVVSFGFTVDVIAKVCRDVGDKVVVVDETAFADEDVLIRDAEYDEDFSDVEMVQVFVDIVTCCVAGVDIEMPGQLVAVVVIANEFSDA